MLPQDKPLKEPSPEEIKWLLPLLNEPVFKVVDTGSITFVYQDRPYIELDYKMKHLADTYMVLPTKVQNCLYFVHYPYGGILEISDLSTIGGNSNGININIAILDPSGFRATVCYSVKLTNSDITNVLLAYATLPKNLFLSPEEVTKLLTPSEEQKQS